MLSYFKHLPRMDQVGVADPVYLGQMLVGRAIFSGNTGECVPTLDGICLGSCSRPVDLEHLTGVYHIRVADPIDIR